MFSNLIKKNRSYRRFDNSYFVPMNLLKELVNYARLSPSAGNLQPLKFIISNTPKTNKTIFDSLAWAGYLKDWSGPIESEKPSAYIVILGDKNIAKNPCYDAGIASQSILLGAVDNGLGGCIFGSIKREQLAAAINIAPEFEILLVIALGKPVEKVVIEEAKADIKYWRDAVGTHHVPKRALDEIILWEL